MSAKTRNAYVVLDADDRVVGVYTTRAAARAAVPTKGGSVEEHPLLIDPGISREDAYREDPRLVDSVEALGGNPTFWRADSGEVAASLRPSKKHLRLDVTRSPGEPPVGMPF